MLDGLLLDGSNPEAVAQLLQAAVLDCRAALELVPTHTKAHYRFVWDTRECVCESAACQQGGW